MPIRLLLAASTIALSANTPVALAQTDTPLTDIIVVTGHTPVRPDIETLDASDIPPGNPDAASMIARIPGGATISNGALSGQAQYRGLFGPRINIRIDGLGFQSGGPNLMDPPLSYAPLPLVDRIEVERGVSPVRYGPGLAGGMNAVFKRVEFVDQADLQFGYDVSFEANTRGDSIAVGGVAGGATDKARFHILASLEDGGDIDYPGGTIGGTRHNRSVYGLGGGLRHGSHEFSLDIRRHETGDTGNPPFAMDIRYIDTDMAQARYDGEFGDFSVSARLGYTDVAHAMNNYDLRLAPPPMRQRETFAYGTTHTAGLIIGLPAWGGELRLGVGTERAKHNVLITNPNNANFFLNNLPDIDANRTGLFAEWTGDVGSWNAELGLRLDRQEDQSSTAQLGSAVPAMPGMLAMAFNQSDRTWDDTTADLVARLWTPVSNNTVLRVNLARKTRVPTYVERFAWLPTPASGGLADGNTYVGDLHLDAETAWIAEAGFDWQTADAYLRPTVFFRQVDDYIQGVPFDDTPGVVDTPVEMVSSMNGDPTPLRFSNTDAKLYGVDLDFGLALDHRWRIDGVASWIRGERRDIDDNLYRIAPSSLRIGTTYVADRWSTTLEGLAIAEQDRVSATNNEAATSGYVLLNMYGRYDIGDGMHLSLSAENLLDHSYRQHLAGYNRNTLSDIAVGERLPGPGRSLGIRLHMRR